MEKESQNTLFVGTSTQAATSGTAVGSATGAPGKKGIGTLSTTPNTLTVNENSGLAAIGISAPIDSAYPASRLTVTVTGLPSDGTVYLSDGISPVSNGQTLSVAQLTSLMFRPTAGLFGRASAFAYQVTDPSGRTASGSATLSIAPDSLPPVTTAASLTVSGNAGPTAMGIIAPTDPNYSASQLSVQVTGLPSDGTVLLSDGATVVLNGQSLSVSQLTSLKFKPLAGAFSTSSTFQYTVTDPSGLNASGTATIAIAPDTLPPTTAPVSLTVPENSGPTPIGIATPIDPNYPLAQLTITVTGLPTDGRILLGDGLTSVSAGETLTATQLTGLMFEPTAGAFGVASTFSYKVADPAGLSTTGNATLAIGPDTLPPVTTDPTLTVAPNSGPIRIGIPAPTDPNFSTSQLSVTVTGLPADGAVLLSDGVTGVSLGETLTVAQLTGTMFEPTAGLSGQSSNFTYSVTNPAGLTSSGEETLAISGNGSVLSADGSVLNAGSGGSLVTAAGTWSFSATAAAGGFVILLNGQPASGGSAVTLEVANGDNLYAHNSVGNWYEWVNGNWAAVPAGLTTSSSYSSVAANSAATPIGITAPIDLFYSPSQLTVSVTQLPSNGTILLSDGVTPVTLNETLTVSQLTGLEFKPAANVSNVTSGFGYTVSDPSLATSSNVASLNVTGSSNTIWSDPGVAVAPGVGVDVAPQTAQPTQSGDIVGVRLQNTGATTEASGYVTFGQVFQDGTVHPGESLVARINGVNYAVQMDVNSTNADGSVRQATLTLDAPAIAAGGALDLMLSSGVAPGPSPTAPSASALLTSGYNTSVNFTFHNADGTTTTDSTSAAAALQAALNGGTVRSWLSGPEVNEYDVTTTVDGGKLKVEFDIRAYANGTTTTDVIFDNGWFFSPGRTDLNYDVSINQGGQQVYNATGVQQYLYSMWDHQVNSAGTVSPNVQYDVPYLMATGALQSYDTSYGVSDAGIAFNAGGPYVPMGNANVALGMVTAGSRQDIGTQPTWTTDWLLSQNATAYNVMMANAEASGSIPWHYTDENTGEPISGQTYTNIFGVGPGSTNSANGGPQTGVNGDNWGVDPAHQPDLNYVPYLVSGSHYQLELLQSQADYSIISVQGYANAFDNTGTVPTGFAALFDIWNLGNNGNQIRGVAWELRQVAEAAYITPDSDPMKAYFTDELNVAMKGLVQEYIVDNTMGRYGQLNGFINNPTVTTVAPWEEDYFVTALSEVAGMNLPQASQDAVQMLQYMNNFVSGLYTNGANGYNPLDGDPYYMNIEDPNTGTPYTSWAQLYQNNLSSASPWSDGYPGLNPNPTTLIGHAAGPATFGGGTLGGYAEIAKAALAGEITYTQSPQAIQAYGFVVSQIAYAYAQAGVNEAQDYQRFAQWSVVPRLPDGTLLENSQMQIDVSGASSVTLTASGGDSLLAVVGNGTATLNGGSGTTDLMYGGTGSTTFNPGSGNDYMFGAYNATGTTIFNDNTGNNWMHGGGGPNLYVFAENNSGHDTIDNLNLSTDHLHIAPNLNGNGLTTASQLIQGATVSNGNTTLHLSPTSDITLLGVNQPSNLLNSILVS